MAKFDPAGGYTRNCGSIFTLSTPVFGSVAGWGDADHQQSAFTEREYRDAVSAYLKRRGDAAR
jgi:hypothetical protein